MSKKKQYIITLLAKGDILQDLHYGIYARYWWEPRKFDQVSVTSIPYRLFMSVNCSLNDKNFAITVLNDKKTHRPSFRCLCDGKDSGNQQSASAAINNTYKQIFGNKSKTEYSGIIVMGFENETITQELLADISFIPIFIRLGRILVVVSQIGVSSCEGYYGAGSGYLSTLITKYRDKQSLFVQSIEEDKCNLDIYDEDIVQCQIKEITPDKVWKSIDLLKKYDGAALFGITNSYTQKELNKMKENNPTITCTSDDWNNIDILSLVFKQHIKTRRIPNTFSDWSKLFVNWYKENNTIIQFPDVLFQIYPADYQFQEKELNAWRVMFRASGCTNITPFAKKQYVIEFWTKASDPSFDRENLANLYKSGMLLLMEKKSHSQYYNESEIFWKSLQKALEVNKRGIDGKIRILSIIAEDFTYKKLKENLNVSF